MQQGGENACGGALGTGVHRHLQGREYRSFPVHDPGKQLHTAGIGRHQVLVPGELGQGSAAAEAADVAEHQVRMAIVELLELQAPPGQGAGPPVAHQHVGARAQAVESFHISRI